MRVYGGCELRLNKPTQLTANIIQKADKLNPNFKKDGIKLQIKTLSAIYPRQLPW